MTVRRLLGFALIIAVGLLWMWPSDLVELVAKQRHILLGRYSLERLSGALVLTPLLLALSWLCFVPSKQPRVRAMKIIAVLTSILLTLVVADLIARMVLSPRYIVKLSESRARWPHQFISGPIKHRPPDQHYEITFYDKPIPHLTYPDAPTGFEKVRVELSTDKHGYRNLSTRSKYHIVTVGDSFTEGTFVSDNETWSALLARRLGRPIYNLGISGASPNIYLSNYLHIGLELKPEILIVTIYEGNDFKEKSKSTNQESVYDRIKRAIKSSPLNVRARQLLTGKLGGYGDSSKIEGIDQLSWMPISIKTLSGVHHYNFLPRRVSNLLIEPKQYAQSDTWEQLKNLLREFKSITTKHGTRLIILFAASKPRVVLPMAIKGIDARQLYYFALLGRANVPDHHRLKATISERLGSYEALLKDFCRNEGIEMISTTQALSRAIQNGKQVYYTYDQHWTRLGHITVAQVIHNALKASH